MGSLQISPLGHVRGVSRANGLYDREYMYTVRIAVH